jgi:RNA polymerase sigma factor (sigma-70 family)
MPHDNDADDAQLFASGEIDALLARYEDAILGRCIARLHGAPDAEDVAQDAKLRLLAEFHRGKSYGDLPYRVVVHKVTGWTILDYFENRPTDVPLPDDWLEPEGDNPYAEVDEQLWLVALLEQIGGRTGEVLRLFHVEGLTHEEIAAELEMTRNAVDQALFRGHAKLRSLLDYD